jgi:hypothetical protein
MVRPNPSMHHRFDDLAARLTEKARRGGAAATGAASALKEDYWQSVQDLFTRDVTEQGLRELVAHDARETFRFFTREIDLQDIKHRPFYERYPIAAFRVFLALAHRLSPWRRVLFAVAVPLTLLGWVRYLVDFWGRQLWMFPPIHNWEGRLLIASTLLTFLLVLELRDKLGLKGDLEVARQIQFGLLPFEPYERGGISIATSMRPANTVGGDYFDIVELGEEKIAVVVGDVAGKGMPAALLMALLQGSLRTLLTAGHRGADLLGKLNAHLCANIPSNRLVTFFYGELDIEGGELHYLNAGHNAPFVIRYEGGIERLPATGMALGIAPAAVFETHQTRLGAGDRLFLYTDGVTEAFNRHDVEYGEERLRSFLEGHRHLSHNTLLDALIADVLAFCAGERPRDDMTLMVVGRPARFEGRPS